MMFFSHKKQEDKEITESNLICPRCIIKMETVKTDGIVADVCPSCKSVIISRFDLDKTVIHFIKKEEKLI